MNKIIIAQGRTGEFRVCYQCMIERKMKATRLEDV